MPALLTLIGAVSIFFFAVAFVMIRRHPREWTGWAISLPSLFLGCIGVAVAIGVGWTHYTPPTATSVLADLYEIARYSDRADLHAALLAHGFKPMIFEQTIPVGRAQAYGIGEPEAVRSTSFVNLRTTRVRPHDLMAEYLDVVFLFDNQGRLITWSYLVVSPGL